MIKKIFFVVLTAFCFTGVVHGFPVLTGRVVDEANILSEQQKNDLERVLEQVHPHQVVAVSLKSLDGKEIEEYGYQLGRHWGIGRKGENDGVLVLIAPNQRQLRIEVGYGLEHVLTDAQSSKIVNNVMVPLARDGKYDEALVQGATAVVQVLGGKIPNQLSTTDENVSTSYGSPVVAWIIVLSFLLWFGLMIGLSFVQTKCKHYKRSSKQNRFLFFYENVFCSSLTYNIIIVFILAGAQSVLLYLAFLLSGLFVVNSGNMVRWHKNPKFPYKKQFQQSGGGSSSHGGWSSSGGSFSSHGGSSFHGGGGSFGGGGASGRF